MSRFTGSILGLTIVLAVVALVFALWPVVTEAPWEDGITEAELHQILEVATQITQEEEEAERLESCEQIRTLIADSSGGFSESVQVELLRRLLDNRCDFVTKGR